MSVADIPNLLNLVSLALYAFIFASKLPYLATCIRWGMIIQEFKRKNSTQNASIAEKQLIDLKVRAQNSLSTLTPLDFILMLIAICTQTVAATLSVIA